MPNRPFYQTSPIAGLFAECGKELVEGRNTIQMEILWLKLPETTSSEPSYPVEANKVNHLALQDV